MSDQYELIEFEDPVDSFGFAQISHAATWDKELSDSAYRTLAVYIQFAHQKRATWVKHNSVAEIRGVDWSTISRHKKELQRLGYIEVKRRWQKPSLILLKKFSSISRLQNLAQDALLERKSHEHGENTMFDEAITDEHGKNAMSEHGKNAMYEAHEHGENAMRIKNNHHDLKESKKKESLHHDDDFQNALNLLHEATGFDQKAGPSLLRLGLRDLVIQWGAAAEAGAIENDWGPGWIYNKIRDGEDPPGLQLTIESLEAEGWGRETIYQAHYEGKIYVPELESYFPYESWLVQKSHDKSPEKG